MTERTPERGPLAAARPVVGWLAGPNGRVIGYSAALALVALLLTAGPARALPLPDSGLHVPWWLLALALAVAEMFPVHFHFGRQSQSFSAGEIPIVVGLAFSSPVGLVLARLVGGAGVLLLQRRHPPLKLAFNAALFALEGSVAVVVFHLLLRGGDPLSPSGWAAAFVATVSAGMLGTMAVSVAISMQEGRWPRSVLAQVLGPSLVATLTNTSLGLLAVTVLAADVRAGWLLVQVTALLLVAYRGYARLRQKHETMALLHELTTVVSGTADSGDAARALLEGTAKLLRANRTQLWLAPTGGGSEDGAGVTVAFGPGPAEASGQPDGDLVTALLAGRAGGRVCRPGTRRPADWRLLESLGERDAVVVPLRGGDGLAGLLIAAGRQDDVSTFDEEDLRLLETIANHASISLRNGRLVERLRREVEAKAHQASHDALTGLPNRTLFNQRVDTALADRAAHVAVMLVDLDRFKEVNDTLGHHTGDALLEGIGARLRETLRPIDTVARLGGDEFAILLPGVGSADEALTVAHRVREALERPFELQDLTLYVGASVGIALAPQHAGDAILLLQRADIAMYAAKDSHRGAEVYTAERDDHSHGRLALVGELRAALAAEDLVLHYQPQAELASGRVVGVEALVRWPHPQRGLVPPDEFIPIAERTGLIRPLTRFVLRTALRQCHEWRRAGHALDVAVNLSVESLLSLELPAEVGRLLDEAAVAAGCLTLEITESMIMADPQRAISVLLMLNGMGVNLAIDDFGTGYSSLSQLKRLPVTELKIDRSFVSTMASDDSDALIVRSTVELGHNLGLRVVAEGVEDPETWSRLAGLGCDVAQGFLLSPAQPPEKVIGWVSDWEAARASSATAESLTLVRS